MEAHVLEKTGVVVWLSRHGAGHPWSDQLAVAATVMVARRLDLATVLGYLRTAQTFLQTLFTDLGLTSMAEGDAERAMRASLTCEVPKVHTLEQRLRFWAVYTSISNHEQMWLRRLSDEDRRRYEVFVLPRLDPRDFKGLVPRVAAMVERKQRRKTETDAVLPHFIDIRNEAHLRFNRLMRVRAAYKQALEVLAERGPSVLPLEFAVDEGGDPERGLSRSERLLFRLWDRRSFILAHRDKYSNTTVCDARTGRRTSADERNRPFVEYVGAERLLDDAPPEGLVPDEPKPLALAADRSTGTRKHRTRRGVVELVAPVGWADSQSDTLRAVLSVIYLIYNAGLNSPLERGLCAEAIRLGRTLMTLMPAEPEVAGLLALLLLTEARRASRGRPDGSLVVLGAQDRPRWDRAAIEEGQHIVHWCLRRDQPGHYQLQAAITAVHRTPRALRTPTDRKSSPCTTSYWRAHPRPWSR